MTDAFDIDGAFGHFAMYEEPPTGPKDDPLYNPLNHLGRIRVHSALAYLQVAVEIDHTINHPSVAASYGWDWSTWSNNWTPDAYVADHLLGTHGLGYVPLCIVASGQGTLEPGLPIQVNGSGGTRFLDVYLTTTQVRARERVDSGTGTLGAITMTYKILVLREPAKPMAGLAFDADDGRVVAGEGWFDSDYHYLRAVASGESPYFVGASQQIDTAGGVCRFIDALGTIRHDFYNAADYTGGLTSVTVRQVQR